MEKFEDKNQTKSKNTIGCLLFIVLFAIIICLPAYWNVYNDEIQKMIGYILLLGALLSLVFSIISLISPQKGLFWIKNNTKKTRLGAFLTYIFFFAFFEVLTYMVMPKNEKKEMAVSLETKKLKSDYYDSIYAIKAQPAIDMMNEPRIELDGQSKKVTVKIRLTQRLSEEEIRAIGIYYHDKYLVAPYNRVYVYCYTPEMENEDAGCYATAHSDPNLEVIIFPQY